MKQIKIGVLGCSQFAIQSVIPKIISLPNFKLVAIASRTIEKCSTLSLQFGCKFIEGYDRLLNEDVDLVYIPLPNGLHSEWIEKSLNANKHVWVEKSLATDYNDVVRLNNLARVKEKILVENFQFRFHKQHQVIKDILNSGDLGEIRSFRSSFGFPPFEDTTNIRYQTDLGGGSLLDAGAYTLKATSFMLGEGFSVQSSQLVTDPTVGVDIYGNGFLTNSKGISSQVSFGFDNFYQCNYEIWGSKGKITVNRAFTAKPGFVPTALFEKQGISKTIQLPEDDHIKNMLEYIAAIIHGASHNEYEQNIEQGRLIHEFRQKAQQVRLSLNK